jgi:hypothetical protein
MTKTDEQQTRDGRYFPALRFFLALRAGALTNRPRKKQFTQRRQVAKYRKEKFETTKQKGHGEPCPSPVFYWLGAKRR